jgi:hypothetical protein
MGTLHEDLFTLYIDELFTDREMFHTKVSKKSKYTFIFNISFFENYAVYKVIWENMTKTDMPQMTM